MRPSRAESLQPEYRGLFLLCVHTLLGAFDVQYQAACGEGDDQYYKPMRRFEHTAGLHLLYKPHRLHRGLHACASAFMGLHSGIAVSYLTTKCVMDERPV